MDTLPLCKSSKQILHVKRVEAADKILLQVSYCVDQYGSELNLYFSQFVRVILQFALPTLQSDKQPVARNL